MDQILEEHLQVLSRSGQTRVIDPHWNHGMIAASIGISLLGAFTSTQLMCQARLSKYMSGILLWSCLASLTFGFCSIWSLHFVATLACELDLPIGLNAPLTILSAVLAVCFTFIAIASDLIWERRRKTLQRRSSPRRHEQSRSNTNSETQLELNGKSIARAGQSQAQQPYHDEPASTSQDAINPASTKPHLPPATQANGHALSPMIRASSPRVGPLLADTLRLPGTTDLHPTSSTNQMQDSHNANNTTAHEELDEMSERNSMDASGASSEPLLSRRSSAVSASDASTFGLGNILAIRTYKRSSLHAKNAFVVTARMLYWGCTLRNALKGLVWSLAVDSMHYIGIHALNIPSGYYRLNPPLVILSCFICWIVCCVGCILMTQMETHFGQQFLFSVVAALGVAAMHFTGMTATTFYSSQEPSKSRGYPPELAAAIAAIAIVTCLSANYLLAHSATVARDKLAEIVSTRKKLWAAIAQKENAEAAARARSDFIASASHEIRTPLHQLQGYGDLLSRTELTEEGRYLLYAIQHATRSLSMITSNVLDWSRLEKGEASCRPVALDVRLVCESIVNLLPNREDDVQAELMVVVAPEVPQSLFLDETYIQRILMNLLSNAIKFTSMGYVLLLLEMDGNTLVATVRDTGTGIPESFLPELFEPFTQAQTRGAQRGTGLGLSIIKQLLQKMQGTIDVTSKHKQADNENGTTFIVKIPAQLAPSTQPPLISPKMKEKIMMFSALDQRTIQGLRTAWESYGFSVVVAEDVDAIAKDVRYVWTTIPFLRINQGLMSQLKQRPNTTVLVPYDSPDALAEIPGLTSTPRFITLQRPLIWHRVVQTLKDESQRRSAGIVDKSVRFAADVQVMEDDDTARAPAEAKTLTIFLVEDNKINQKLGTKMLKTLGYHVITADDGQDAVEKIVEHDSVIDAILMDQSMPRKDGLTATREIRAMEEDGTLSRRRPIIAVTAVVGPEAQGMCRDAGTDDFLPKPLSLAKLGQALKHHLRSVQ